MVHFRGHHYAFLWLRFSKVVISTAICVTSVYKENCGNCFTNRKIMLLSLNGYFLIPEYLIQLPSSKVFGGFSILEKRKKKEQGKEPVSNRQENRKVKWEEKEGYGVAIMEYMDVNLTNSSNKILNYCSKCFY